MQQAREQYSLVAASREPTQWTTATRFGVLAVLQYDLPAGRTAGIDQALELDAGQNILQLPIIQFGDAGRVEVTEAGGQDDRPDRKLVVRLLHVVVDGAPVAGCHALQAFGARPAADAAFGLDQGFLLGQGQVHFAEVVVALLQWDGVDAAPDAFRWPRHGRCVP